MGTRHSAGSGEDSWGAAEAEAALSRIKELETHKAEAEQQRQAAEQRAHELSSRRCHTPHTGAREPARVCAGVHAVGVRLCARRVWHARMGVCRLEHAWPVVREARK